MMSEFISDYKAAVKKQKAEDRTKDHRVRRRVIRLFVATALFAAVFISGFVALAADTSVKLSISGAQTPSGTASSLQMLFLLTIIALLPSILIMTTSFTRIIIVLSLLRNALGLQQSPPNMVLVGIALFLTLFIMSPVLSEINTKAYQPYVNGKITMQKAEDNAIKPLRNFMMKNTENTSMKVFLKMAKIKAVKTTDDIPTYVLIPAFILSELKKAFMMGFVIYLPFLVIDIIVSSTLMSMGMMMLPPQTISLPIKMALFVLVDGWTLTVQSLVQSFK
jgi:flagellar biosynthetic protein FliP